MTLEQIRSSDKDFLIPADIAEVLDCNPHSIRIEAANGTLPFHVIRVGSRTKIPRMAFLAWMDGTDANENRAIASSADGQPGADQTER